MNTITKKMSIIESMLPDSLYSDSKDWVDGGIIEKIDWLLFMYEHVKAERDLLYTQLQNDCDSQFTTKLVAKN